MPTFNSCTKFPGIMHDPSLITTQLTWLLSSLFQDSTQVGLFISYTAQTFNSCTKCLGIMHDRTPNCHPVYWAGMHDCTTGRSFDLQATFLLFRKCCFLLTTSAFTVYNDISIVFQVFFSIILFGSYRNSSMHKCIKILLIPG